MQKITFLLMPLLWFTNHALNKLDYVLLPEFQIGSLDCNGRVVVYLDLGYFNFNLNKSYTAVFN